MDVAESIGITSIADIIEGSRRGRFAVVGSTEKGF